jgi:hypothetical protein
MGKVKRTAIKRDRALGNNYEVIRVYHAFTAGGPQIHDWIKSTLAVLQDWK